MDHDFGDETPTREYPKAESMEAAADWWAKLWNEDTHHDLYVDYRVEVGTR